MSMCCGYLRPQGARLLFRVPEIGFDGPFELDRHGLAETVHRLASGDADPAFADAVFFHIGLFGAVEFDADAAFEQFRVVERALGIGGEAIWRDVVGHLFLKGRNRAGYWPRFRP